MYERIESNNIPKYVYFQRKTYKDKTLIKLHLTIKLWYVKFVLLKSLLFIGFDYEHPLE